MKDATASPTVATVATVGQQSEQSTTIHSARLECCRGLSDAKGNKATFDEMKQRYNFTDDFQLNQQLKLVFHRYRRRARAAEEAGKTTEQHERMKSIAESGNLPEQPQVIDIARLALNGWIHGQSQPSTLRPAAQTAAEGLEGKKTGRPPQTAQNYLVEKLALIFLDGTGKQPTRQKLPDGSFDSEFMRFCRDCMSILEVADDTENGLRKRIEKVQSRMTNSGLRQRGKQFRGPSDN